MNIVFPEYYVAAEKSIAPSGQMGRSAESDPSLQNEIEQLRTSLKTLSLRYFKQECNLHMKKISELPCLSVSNVSFYTLGNNL